jgi:hypothetical protein
MMDMVSMASSEGIRWARAWEAELGREQGTRFKSTFKSIDIQDMSDILYIPKHLKTTDIFEGEESGNCKVLSIVINGFSSDCRDIVNNMPIKFKSSMARLRGVDLVIFQEREYDSGIYQTKGGYGIIGVVPVTARGQIEPEGFVDDDLREAYEGAVYELLEKESEAKLKQSQMKAQPMKQSQMKAQPSMQQQSNECVNSHYLLRSLGGLNGYGATRLKQPSKEVSGGFNYDILMKYYKDNPRERKAKYVWFVVDNGGVRILSKHVNRDVMVRARLVHWDKTEGMNIHVGEIITWEDPNLGKVQKYVYASLIR